MATTGGNSNAATIVRDGDTITFIGKIDTDAARALDDAFSSGANKLIIRSEGGPAGTALFPAQTMLMAGVDIIVDKYCLSSCANYLFLAARQKSLRPGAVLGFHGTANGKIADSAEAVNSVPFARSIFLFDSANGEFYKYIRFDLNALMARSQHLTNIPEAIRKLDLTVNGEKFSHVYKDDASLEKFTSDLFVTNPQIDKGKIVHQWNIQPDSLSAVYFPSKATLVGLGVQGIGDYPYPVSQLAMDKLGKSARAGLKLFGDYQKR